VFKPVPVAIGLRYLRARRQNRFISFISLISLAGLALGVAALITVLSVMNGFEKEIRDRMLGLTAHVTIRPEDGNLQSWEKTAAALAARPKVLGTAPFVKGEGLLSHQGLVRGVEVQGLLPERESKVSDIQAKMVQGDLKALVPGKFRILLGQELMAALGVTIGDKLTLIIPQPVVTPAGMIPRLKQFTVAGSFSIGASKFDSTLALIHLQDAARLYRLGNSVTGLHVKVNDVLNARAIAGELTRHLGGGLKAADWSESDKTFFQALRTERVVMFSILMLVVAVAAFNIVSTLVMVVRDKEADVAIVRTLGLSPAAVMTIFFVQGIFIGILGDLIGTVGGVALASHLDTIVPMIETVLSTKLLPPDLYFLDSLPSDLRWHDVFWISGVAFVLCLLATIYPAWQAAHVQPAAALRYE
jgi:lipoprotein-releasing system permease protein